MQIISIPNFLINDKYPCLLPHPNHDYYYVVTSKNG